MKTKIRIEWRDLLDGALATAELPNLPHVEPEPLERFALVVDALADVLPDELAEGEGAHHKALALEALRSAGRHLWQASRAAGFGPVAIISADGIAHGTLTGNVLRVRAELQEGDCYD